MKQCHKLIKSAIASIAFLAVWMSPMAFAQENAPPPWLDVVRVQVKNGMGLDFEDRVRELQAARRAAGLPAMQIFQVVRGRPNEYHMVTPVASLAEQNGPAQLMSPAENATWMARITSTVDSVRFLYAITYPQHEVEVTAGGVQPELLLLRTSRVVLGKEAEYEAWITDQYMPAFRQTNPLGHTMARGVFGDDVSTFYHAQPIANWAAFDAGDPLLAVLGQRRMEQMLDAIDGVVASSELIVARIRYDLMGAE
jgi:hypothetical protein